MVNLDHNNNHDPNRIPLGNTLLSEFSQQSGRRISPILLWLRK